MSGDVTCKQKINCWMADHFQRLPSPSELPGARTVMAMGEIISASAGIVLSLVFTEAMNIFQGALLSSSTSVASAVSAALVMPFNYSIMAVLSSAMRASKNFFDDVQCTLFDGNDLGRRWRTALLYAFVVGTVVGIPSFILAPRLISLLPLGDLHIENTLSVSLALSYNLIMMAAVPLRLMRAVDRQLFLKTGNHNKWMMGMSLVQALLTAGASYGFSTLPRFYSHWPLSPAQSIACGGVLGSLIGLVATQIYLLRKSRADVKPKSQPQLNFEKTPFSSPLGLRAAYGSIFGNSPVSMGASTPTEKDETSLAKYQLYQVKKTGWFSPWSDIVVHKEIIRGVVYKKIIDHQRGLIIPGAHNALSYLAEIVSNLSLIAMMGYLGPVEFIANNIASQSVQLFLLLDTGLSMGLQKIFTEEDRQKHGFAYLRAAFLLALGVTDRKSVV